MQMCTCSCVHVPVCRLSVIRSGLDEMKHLIYYTSFGFNWLGIAAETVARLGVPGRANHALQFSILAELQFISASAAIYCFTAPPLHCPFLSIFIFHFQILTASILYNYDSDTKQLPHFFFTFFKDSK